jgi:hypothetical protein
MIIVMSVAVRPEDGPPPGYPISLDEFTAYNPDAVKPGLQVIL